MSKTGNKSQVEQWVSDYIMIRDTKALIAERHKAEMERVNKALAKIERLLSDVLNEQGVEAMRTTSGMVHRSIKTSTTVEDREAYMAFVRENEAWNFLESKANKTAVEEYLEEHGELPPGVRVSRFVTVRIVR